MNGKSVKLRAVEIADLDLLYKWENDSSVWHISNTTTPFSRYLLEEYIANANLDIYSTKQLRLMIEQLESRAAIGCIDLFDFDPLNRRAGVGILICSEQRNKGFASEALGLLIGYGFDILNLQQLYCNILADNTDSLKLFEKSGFERIGLKKKWILMKDLWFDEYMLQLIRK
jgi:diamine N-acetyltransferase